MELELLAVFVAVIASYLQSGSREWHPSSRPRKINNLMLDQCFSTFFPQYPYQIPKFSIPPLRGKARNSQWGSFGGRAPSRRRPWESGSDALSRQMLG